MFKIYSKYKQEIIEDYFKTGKISIPALLITGEKGVGKKVLTFNIIKRLLNKNNFPSIFSYPEFLYIGKSLPFNEIEALYKLIITKNKNLKNLNVIIEKLNFLILTIIHQYVHGIIEFKKELDESLMDELANFFNFSINFKVAYNDNEDFNNYYEKIINKFLDIKNMVFALQDNLKNEYIYIKEIHRLQEWILRQSVNKKKIIFLDSIEKMTVDAANSFLKTLEEPPSNTYFFLTSNNRYKLLSTIISRTSMYHIETLEQYEIEMIIKDELGEEFLEVLSLNIRNFERVIEILLEDQKRAKILEDAKKLFELIFYEKENYKEFYKLIVEIENKREFLEEFLGVLDNYRQKIINKIFIVDKGISIFQIENIMKFIDFIINSHDNLNYSIENGLIFLYLNKERIFNGDFNGAGLFL